MEITYLGHSAFKLKNGRGSVVMDPYDENTGWALPKQTADVVTVSHNHGDHSAVDRVKTADGGEPMIISVAGEYETRGISVFGVESWHDDKEGVLRGDNIIFTVLMDGVSVCHLGDLGHKLTDEQIGRIGEVDVLLCPVGGYYTLDAKVAVEVMGQLEPKIFIPMHYRTPLHNTNAFADVAPIESFFNEYGIAPAPIKKLEVQKARLPEETEIVVLDSGIV